MQLNVVILTKDGINNNFEQCKKNYFIKCPFNVIPQTQSLAPLLHTDAYSNNEIGRAITFSIFNIIRKCFSCTLSLVLPNKLRFKISAQSNHNQ